MAGISAEVVTMTPQMAQVILDDQATIGEDKSICQRATDRTRIAQYAREMKAGTWLLNGEGIQLNGSRLLNGQHRLKAVVLAGVGVPMLVVRGVDTAAFATIDQGKGRTLGNVLQMSGMPYRAEVGGAARMAMLYEQFGNVDRMADRRPAIPEIVAYAMAHQDALVEGGYLSVAVKLGHRSTLATLAFLGRFRTERAEFFRRLTEGIELRQDEPVRHLRERFIANNAQREHARSEVMFAYAIKAWNATIQGQPMGRLFFRSNETYPVMVR